MDKCYKECVISYHAPISSDCYSMILKVDEMADYAKPGQFVNVIMPDKTKLLPRPISICEVNKETKELRLVYRAVGSGTKLMSEMHAGDTLKLMGPLGNGYTFKDYPVSLLIGGGIGIPPLLELAKELPGEKIIVLGFRDEIFLADEFEKYGKVYIASEDGKTGTKGNVLDAIRANGIKGQAIYACGPTPMLRAIKEYGLSEGYDIQLSLEERMACGIGACLACVCESVDMDDHSHVTNKRVCKEGPVFNATEVTL